MSTITLYGYKLSSASYRVRIALNTAGIAFDTVPVNLLTGEQKQAEHLTRNPQGIVPALDIDGLMLTQSTAIIEYLDETRDLGFMPKDPVERQRLRALSNAIAMEIQPICNSGIIAHVQQIATGEPEQVRDDWMHKYIRQGLLAFETMLDHPNTGRTNVKFASIEDGTVASSKTTGHPHSYFTPETEKRSKKETWNIPNMMR